MNYIAQCLERFRKLPESTKQLLGGFEILEILEVLEDKYGIQLGFLVILISIGEISLDRVPEYLEKKFGFSEEDAFDLRSDLERNIFSLLLINNDASEISGEEIKLRFANGLIDLLKNESLAFEVNHNIFGLFSKDGSMQENLTKIFLSNQEKLTSSRLIAEDREIPGTIANWLKDFIKTNGSEIFDDLILAQYLSTSLNAKKLNPEEKNLVRKILKLYRSLAFFPESMENLAIQDWQIIPYDKSENNHQEMRDVLGDEETQTQAKMKTSVAPSRSLRPVKPVMSEKSKAPATPVNNETSTLFELQDALKSYTPESLEHKAVAQEIERLNKKKKTK